MASHEMKRRIDADKRLFDDNWEHEFVCFLEYDQKTMCLMCYEFASINDVCYFLPVHLSPNVCHKLSQTFGVDEAALKEDFIDLKIVPGLKEKFLAAKGDLVLFWVTKVPVRFLALREADQKSGFRILRDVS